jgi:protein gp37
MSTAIEWTWVPDGTGGFKKGETWNVQVGCVEVSPACRHCYAASTAHLHAKSIPQHAGLTVMRSNGVHWNGEINRVPKLLEKPLRWRDPRGIFVGSMTDTFLRVDTEEDMRWIAALFGVMAATPQHTYMLLTKRPENAAKWFAWVEAHRRRGIWKSIQAMICADLQLLLPEETSDSVLDKLKGPADVPWPLPNVWMGVTAEDQQRAEERIPVLLQLPAVTRFISYEPACGPIDLSRWIERLDHCGSCGESFGPQQEDVCPECGSEYGLIATWGEKQAEDWRSGERYADGGPHDDDDGPQIHWVIAGGESGAGARPSHPEWFRSVRDQCVAAGLAFFFKQHGEFGPSCVDSRDGTAVFRSFPDHATWVSKALTWLNKGDVCVDMTGRVLTNGGDFKTAVYPVSVSRKLGKGFSGRELDGRTWDEFPACGGSERV